MAAFRWDARIAALAPFVLLACAQPLGAAEEAGGGDAIGKYLAGDPENLTVSLKILALVTILSIAPSILLLTTAFPRIVIVLGFVRRALSTNEVPPNQVIIGLSLILTFMVMAPTWNRIHATALAPFLSEEISDEEALRRSVGELRSFMLPQTDQRDLELMVSISHPEMTAPRACGGSGYSDTSQIPIAEVPTFTVMSAFLLSEMKRAFEMGFLIYLPFVVIDLVVASTLIAMGMLVLPPVLISLPFKILVFVLVDGWSLVVEQLVVSFNA